MTENLENKETNIEKNDVVLNEDKPLTTGEFKNMLSNWVNQPKDNDHKEIPPSKITMGNDYEGTKNALNNWLFDIRKNNVTVEIPKQFSTFIPTMTGTYGRKGECYRIGDLVSNVATFQRSVSGGTQGWATLSQRITSAASGALSSTVLNVTPKINYAVVSLYDYQLNSSFDFVNYANKEINRIIPQAEDIQIFTGDGTYFTGIYNDPYMQYVNAGGAAGFSITSTRAMVAKIDPQYRNSNLKWYVDMSDEQTLLAFADANNRYVDVAGKFNTHLGYEVVPMSSGVLNGSSVSTHLAKRFVLANLQEAVQYADRGMVVEPLRTAHNATDYVFSITEAFAVVNPLAAVVARSVTA